MIIALCDGMACTRAPAQRRQQSQIVFTPCVCVSVSSETGELFARQSHSIRLVRLLAELLNVRCRFRARRHDGALAAPSHRPHTIKHSSESFRLCGALMELYSETYRFCDDFS